MYYGLKRAGGKPSLSIYNTAAKSESNKDFKWLWGRAFLHSFIYTNPETTITLLCERQTFDGTLKKVVS